MGIARWSSALQLEKELQPFEVMEFEPMADSVKKAFEAYRAFRTKITGWYAATSERRAELANRHKKNREVETGSRVLYRDPQATAVGGRLHGRSRSPARVSLSRRRATVCNYGAPMACQLKHTWKT